MKLIFKDGKMFMVGTELSPELGGLGIVTHRRASHIWPKHRGKRIAFRILRAIFGDRHIVSVWCRTWQGRWQVRFTSDPRVVAYESNERRACVNWEVRQLNKRLCQS